MKQGNWGTILAFDKHCKNTPNTGILTGVFFLEGGRGLAIEPDWSPPGDPPASVSQVDRITGMHHHTQLR
jgi:hypothetical protein